MPYDNSFSTAFGADHTKTGSSFGDGFDDLMNLAEEGAFRNWYHASALIEVIGSADDKR